MTLVEVAAVMTQLEEVVDALADDPGTARVAARVDDAIGRMSRWIWPVLGDLDREDER